jgi:hypothetical protein
LAGEAERETAFRRAWNASYSAHNPAQTAAGNAAYYVVAEVVDAAHVARGAAAAWAWAAGSTADDTDEADIAEAQRQCDLVRCIFGNPFRVVHLDPAWLTPQALAVAGTAYVEDSWDGLPLLADALEEAGCSDAAILSHLRGPGPHFRGCWVVDLLLGKE